MRIKKIEIHGEDVTFFFDKTGNEPFGIYEFRKGSKIRTQMQLVQSHIVGFNHVNPRSSIGRTK